MTSLTRRAYLAAAVGAALAGCTGGGDGGDTVAALPPPVAGDPNAAHTVMVFEDFACPHCATYSLEVFPRIESAYLADGRIRYEHHDFPIPVDERWSWQAASAARGVQDTVDDATFFDYAERLFANQARYSLDLIAEQAEAVGADGGTIRSAASEERYRPVLETDRALGEELELRGTPQVYVDGDRLDDARFGTIASVLDERL